MKNEERRGQAEAISRQGLFHAFEAERVSL
jgi:hypothetical protein